MAAAVSRPDLHDAAVCDRRGGSGAGDGCGGGCGRGLERPLSRSYRSSFLLEYAPGTTRTGGPSRLDGQPPRRLYGSLGRNSRAGWSRTERGTKLESAKQARRASGRPDTAGRSSGSGVAWDETLGRAPLPPRERVAGASEVCARWAQYVAQTHYLDLA